MIIRAKDIWQPKYPALRNPFIRSEEQAVGSAILSLPLPCLPSPRNPSSEAVRQLLSPPLAGGDNGEGEIGNISNIGILLDSTSSLA
jgi:hypothetical protein